MDRRPATSRRDRRAAATRLSGNALRRADSTSVRPADQVALKTMTGHPHHGLLVARDSHNQRGERLGGSPSPMSRTAARTLIGTLRQDLAQIEAAKPQAPLPLSI
jgi:hypothetical protein